MGFGLAPPPATHLLQVLIVSDRRVAPRVVEVVGQAKVGTRLVRVRVGVTVRVRVRVRVRG